ncbi:hypothetical protein DT076_15500 [Desertihabitans brevis]|uniref:Heavy metal transporter n=1 Tax=Desertihabitans brevis TaxID=2268447 RepID=A0A367YSA1_9ACTN|nr:hypothetical protein [Desertihabitans brevis]RCK68627.1 hypothetical protein DT076_15500 [Desertihabitans brevis]
MTDDHPRRGATAVGCLVVLALVLAVAGGGYALVRSRGVLEPPPPQTRCVATAGERSVTLTPDQAHYTAIITGVSVRRGLAPRAASIAMATVYQETDIRNLDWGDRDSVGLFQQRPSQGWGTVEEILDPHYATGRFYDALVQVDGWESGDINDVAQAVQRSGYPEAYRDHEADGRVLASVFTGHSPAGLRCALGPLTGADPDALVVSLTETLGDLDTDLREAGEDGPAVLEVDTDADATAWAVASHALAEAARHGVTTVAVGDRVWQHDPEALTGWEPSEEDLGRTVRITFTIG